MGRGILPLPSLQQCLFDPRRQRGLYERNRNRGVWGTGTMEMSLAIGYRHITPGPLELANSIHNLLRRPDTGVLIVQTFC